MSMPMETWPQFRNRVAAGMVTEYGVTRSEALEVAETGPYRTEWTNRATEWMRGNVPSGRMWRSLLRDLGRDFIMRRVFHDAPDSARGYVLAGLPIGPES